MNPDVAWEITDRIKWYTGFRSKWTFYDELDSEGNPKDLTSLLAKTNLTFKPIEKLKIIPSFQKVSCVSRWGSRAQSLSGLIMSSE